MRSILEEANINMGMMTEVVGDEANEGRCLCKGGCYVALDTSAFREVFLPHLHDDLLLLLDFLLQLSQMELEDLKFRQLAIETMWYVGKGIKWSILDDNLVVRCWIHPVIILDDDPLEVS